MNEVLFVVYGTPAPAGSKKAVPMGGRWGVIDDSKRSGPWKANVAQRAGEAMGSREILRGPLEVTFKFFVRRPKSHLNSKGLIRPNAPEYPVVKPDVLKLARAVEDGMTGVVYGDDAQIVREGLSKEYGTERVEVRIVELQP